MKRLLLSLGVIGVYVLYSIGIRHHYPFITKTTALSKTSPTANPNSSAGSSSPSSSASADFQDGTYTGSVADAFYGNVQVSVTITGGKITAVKFLQSPNTHSTSVFINQQAMPILAQEAIQAQSSNVQVVSGATFTSQAFEQSLASALAKA